MPLRKNPTVALRKRLFASDDHFQTWLCPWSWRTVVVCHFLVYSWAILQASGMPVALPAQDSSFLRNVAVPLPEDQCSILFLVLRVFYNTFVRIQQESWRSSSLLIWLNVDILFYSFIEYWNLHFDAYKLYIKMQCFVNVEETTYLLSFCPGMWLGFL